MFTLKVRLHLRILIVRCGSIRCGGACSMNFAINMVPDGDKAFFETLEHCAAENAEAITQLNTEMNAFKRHARKNMRGLNGYRS